MGNHGSKHESRFVYFNVNLKLIIINYLKKTNIPGIKSLLHSVFPKIVSMASNAKVSNNCSAGILKWIVNIRHMKSWALKSK